jgi:hypothetical protein
MFRTVSDDAEDVNQVDVHVCCDETLNVLVSLLAFFNQSDEH